MQGSSRKGRNVHNSLRLLEPGFRASGIQHESFCSKGPMLEIHVLGAKQLHEDPKDNPKIQDAHTSSLQPGSIWPMRVPLGCLSLHADLSVLN